MLFDLQELYPFVSALKEATNLLLEAIRKLEMVHKIDTAQVQYKSRIITSPKVHQSFAQVLFL